VTNMRVLLAGLCAGIVSTAASQAAPMPLHVRTGLWEMTSSGKTTGAPPIPANILAQMPPDRRAKLQAAIAARQARSAAPRVKKQCITAKSMQRGFHVGGNKDEPGYHQTMATSTASVMEVREECGGREKTSGIYHFEATNPETITGNLSVTVSDGVHTMHMTRVIHGKWLSADCGNLKGSD
jgi:hypothetical protein